MHLENTITLQKNWNKESKTKCIIQYNNQYKQTKNILRKKLPQFARNVKIWLFVTL